VGVTRLLLALHPPGWRETYGEEFTALLEDTRLTPSVVIDIVIHAGKLRVHDHRWILVALVWSICLEVLSVHAGLTVNILWSPTNPLRAISLLATVCPWVVLAGVGIRRRVDRGRPRTSRTSR
jgi:hypothetical protein